MDNLKHDQALLNEWFSKHWRPVSDGFTFSNWTDVGAKISNDEWLLDVGCGDNYFRKQGKQVVAIDPANTNADILTTIEDYQPDRLFDVATCLGSINFGSIDVISKQIAKVVSCLNTKSRIYWRLNPGRQDHPNRFCENIDYFPWTLEILQSFADQHGYKQTVGKEESNKDRSCVRLYAEWHR